MNGVSEYFATAGIGLKKMKVKLARRGRKIYFSKRNKHHCTIESFMKI